MATFKLGKLVRDKTVEIYEDSAVTHIEHHYLSKPSLTQQLLVKLQEEAAEAKAAEDKAELIDEIGDVLTIIDALCENEGITPQELEKAKEQKTKDRGAFEKGLWIDHIEVSDPDDIWYQYCDARPHKYPRI